MLWFLTLHIIFLLFWCAALLYLPLYLALVERRDLALELIPEGQASLARFLLTHIATPAALLAIMTGTGVFLAQGRVEPWLIVKLALVALLVLGHALVGWLVVWRERDPDRPAPAVCWTVAGGLCLLMLLIVWFVLAKPDVEGLL